MGACLGSMAGSCLGSCAVGACCTACGCRCLASAGITNLMYVLLVTICAITSVSLRYGGIDLNVGFDVGISGPSVCGGDASACDGAAFAFSICNSHNCKGYWAVYRITFTLTGFFGLMALFTACRCEWSTLVHRGFWFFKVTLFAATLVGMLFAPNDLFAYFAWVARFVAPLFLLYQVRPPSRTHARHSRSALAAAALTQPCVRFARAAQLLIFIDFGYSLNESLLAKDAREDVFFGLENNGFKYHGVILFLSALLYVGAFTAIGLMYSYWPQSCAFNPLAITTTLLFGLLNTGLSISKIAEHGSILCSGLIFAYSVWLCFASLSAFPDPVCNIYQSDNPEEGSSEHYLMLIVSCLVAGVRVSSLHAHQHVATRQPRRHSLLCSTRFVVGSSRAATLHTGWDRAPSVATR